MKNNNIISVVQKEAEKIFKKARGSHDWDHTLRVFSMCEKIGKEEKADMEVVRLAALLHDIGRTKECEAKGKMCHAQEGAKVAKKIMKRRGVPENVIEQVAHCIEAHRFRGGAGGPKTKEAKVLYDSDKLDSLGAVGVGRIFLFAGEIGSRFHNKNVDIHDTKPYTREDTAYREYLVKLRHVPKYMQTKTGKKMTRERHKYMAEFFNRLNKEVDGKI